MQGRTWYSLNPLLIIIFPIKTIKWSEWQWWHAIILIHSQTRLSFLWRIFQLPGFRRRSRRGCADVTASLDGCQGLRSTARETASWQRVVTPNPWVSSWLRTGHWRGWDTQGPMCCFIQSGMVHCNLTESCCNKYLQKALKLLTEDCYAHTRSGGRVLMTIHRVDRLMLPVSVCMLLPMPPKCCPPWEYDTWQWQPFDWGRIEALLHELYGHLGVS